MSDIHADRLIRVETHLRAPLARAFEAWSDPARLSQWYPETVHGQLQTGSTVRFEWGSLGLELDLEIVELEPDRRIAFCGDPGAGPQVQSVELEATSTGTKMIIEHTGFVTADEQAGAHSGWTLGGATLDEYLTRHFGADRACSAVLSTTTSDARTVLDACALPDWLFRTPPSLDIVRSDIDHELVGGMRITGCVLAVSERGELLLRCEQIDGVIALRAFSTAGLVLYGAQVSSWAPDRKPALEALRQELADAIDRLSARLGGPVPAA